MPIANLDDFAALEPFFQIIKDGLGDLVDDVHFFDILSKDVVVDDVITVPGSSRQRTNQMPLQRQLIEFPG